MIRSSPQILCWVSTSQKLVAKFNNKQGFTSQYPLKTTLE